MDLIDRKELIRQIQLQANRSSLGETTCRELTFGEMAGLIIDAPIVDAKPIRHGEWIKWGGMDIPENHGRHKCSECMEFAIKPKYGEEILTDWCLYCGAKMRGKNHDKYRS